HPWRLLRRPPPMQDHTRRRTELTDGNSTDSYESWASAKAASARQRVCEITGWRRKVSGTNESTRTGVECSQPTPGVQISVHSRASAVAASLSFRGTHDHAR